MNSNPLLNIYLKRKEKNSNYSLRAFARNLGVSQSYISLLISGQRRLNASLTEKFSTLLKNEDENKILKDFAQQNGLAAQNVDLEIFKLIRNWYHFAILDLSTTKGFQSNFTWIAKRLGISKAEVIDAVERLNNLGLLITTVIPWKKAARNIHVKSSQPQLAIRQYHQEMMLLASKALENSSQEAFLMREISGTTIAVNSARIAEAKSRIASFQKELAHFLTQGDRDEVYQINIQFFPLTKKPIIKKKE